MKKTEHYQLSQWDLSDPIRMDDFNSDNKRIDDALASLAVLASGDALAAETKRIDGELAKKAPASDLAAAKSSLEAAISGLEAKKLEAVTLLDTTYTLTGTSVNIPVSSLKLGQYAVVSLEIFGSLPSGTSLSVNSGKGTCYYTTGGSGNGHIALVSGNAQLLLFPMKNDAKTVSSICWSSGVSFGISGVAYSSLSNFQVKNDSGLNGYGTISVRVSAIK